MRLRSISGALALATALAAAAPASAQDGDWHFRVAPYLVIPTMDGEAAVRGNTAEVDQSPGDIFSNLNIGFQGYVEARNDSWGVGLDAIYMNLDGSDDDRIAELDVRQGAYTPTVFARLTPAFDVYAGARINVIGADIDFHGPLGIGKVDRHKTWIDPVVGARYSTPIGEKWNFGISADVGGVITGSDFAVNIWPTFGYEISDSAQLTIGYRYMYTDYDSGSGANLFKYDVATYGPVVGAVFDF